MSLSSIDPLFLERCRSIAKDAAKPDIQSPVSPTSALVSLPAPKFDKPDVDPERSRLTDKYPDAFIDTYGTISGAPFVYKTGPAWPKREGGPEAQPYIRELRPIHGHPIMSSWTRILRSAEAYLKERGQGFTAITGFGWANAGDKTPFCPLLVTIGVEPKTVVFEEAKTVADYVKSTILGKAGFPDIDVAVWEWTTSFSGIGPKLPSLHPLVDGAVTEFGHPFASTLGLAIAPLKKPYYEGTVALYLRRGNGSDDVLALTAAHVAHPPPMYLNNTGLSHKVSSKHREEIVALGDKAFEDGTTVIETRIGTLKETIVSENKKIKRLQQQQADGVGDPARISRALQVAQQAVDNATDDIQDIQQLDRLHTHIMTTPNKRCIGQVLHADPVGVSSSEPDGFTIDWAIIHLNKDAFDWDDFNGNKIYIGGKIDEQVYRDLMYPNVSDQVGYEYPEDSLLQICGAVPESEIRQPTQRNAHGDPAMPVIKNGLTTGTTVGWVNGLKSLVRHYDHYDIDFTSLETTIVPYGGRGAFSDGGDSGSMIVDRKGRIVALLTGAGGVTNETDVTFATAWYELEPHIKKTLPGVHLY